MTMFFDPRYNYTKRSWVEVVLDDKIPSYPKSIFAEAPIPRFAQPHGNEIWLLLLEKAFAKITNGYMNMKAGYAGLAWMMLTGCLDYNRWIKEPDGKQFRYNVDVFLGRSSCGRWKESSVFLGSCGQYGRKALFL